MTQNLVESLSLYEEIDEDAIKNYSVSYNSNGSSFKLMCSKQEFNLANNLYYCMVESAAAEQSARMSAMENATNNAGDMISALELKYNRTRQAVITTELIEIISGAAAME